MSKLICRVFLLLAISWACLPSAFSQPRPYIGYVYPAGGQQGTVFQLKLGGQALDEVEQVTVTGEGVSGRIIQYHRSLNPQEITLLNEQLRDLRRATALKGKTAGRKAPEADTMVMMAADQMMMTSGESTTAGMPAGKGASAPELIQRLEKRIGQTVNRPASASLAGIVYVELTIATNAPLGRRELRLVTGRGVSNPLVFHVGQLPEFSRKPMVTAPLQVLGKESQALRNRPASEVENRVALPCTLNGQIASGEENRYRFKAVKGQRLVFTTQARQLIPFIADAVPGWFQPVLVLRDAEGREMAYEDDFRFKPDPTIVFDVPEDGDYVLSIYDAIFRGREDFVYRITAGELPFVTHHFPLGAPAGEPATIQVSGCNLGLRTIQLLADSSTMRLHQFTASGANGLVSNPLPFAFDSLPETLESEPNDQAARAQKIALPVIVNGRMNKPGDADVFQFKGKAGEMVVMDVIARRLDSPLDSVLRLTDAKGAVLAFNDDREDAVAGINTHHADSSLMVRLPADGLYAVHLSDCARNGGEEYAYRLRVGPPQPDFELRVVPSSLALRGRSTGVATVHLFRKEGFAGPVKVELRDAPAGFSVVPVTLTGTQQIARVTIRTTLDRTTQPVTLQLAGIGRVDGREVTREVIAAEDRMQAFLWRHLVPANEFEVLVYPANYQPSPKRAVPSLAAKPASENLVADAGLNKPKFSKQQVAGRLRQLKLLYEEGLLTDDFYLEKVAECEAAN